MYHHLLDYPPFPPQEPSPEMKAFYEKTRERLNKSHAVIITAKEGGGERMIDGVDNYISIYRTTPQTGPMTVTREKKR